MYVTIQRHAASAAPTDERARAGRVVGAHLRKLDGFVAYVLLEDAEGTCVTISIYEDRASCESGNRQLASWRAAQSGEPCGEAAELTGGEVIAQQGL